MNWWENALISSFGYHDLLSNLAALLISLSILINDFPSEILIKVLELFPEGADETSILLCGNLLQYIENHSIRPAQVDISIGLAFSRVLCYDLSILSKFEVMTIIQESFLRTFREICLSNNSILLKIQELYQSRQSQLSRIQSILQ